MPVNRGAHVGSAGPLSAIEQQRWLPVKNTASTTAPPGAAMEIVSVDANGVFQVQRPSKGDLQRERVLINSMSELPPDRFGMGTWDFPVVARVNGSPTLKDALGTVANAWHLAAGKHFILLSEIDNGTAVVGSCPDRSGGGACVPPFFTPCCPDVPVPREVTLTLVAPGSPLLDGLEVELRGSSGSYDNSYHGNGFFGLALGQCETDPVQFPGMFLWYWIGVRLVCGKNCAASPDELRWYLDVRLYQYDINNPFGSVQVASLSASSSIFTPVEVVLNCEPGTAATVECDPFVIASEESAYLFHVGTGNIPPFPDDRNCTGAWVAATLPVDFIIV